MKAVPLKDHYKYTLTKKNSAAKIKKQKELAEDDKVSQLLAEPSLSKQLKAKLKEIDNIYELGEEEILDIPDDIFLKYFGGKDE